MAVIGRYWLYRGSCVCYYGQNVINNQCITVIDVHVRACQVGITAG